MDTCQDCKECLPRRPKEMGKKRLSDMGARQGTCSGRVKNLRVCCLKSGVGAINLLPINKETKRRQRWAEKQIRYGKSIGIQHDKSAFQASLKQAVVSVSEINKGQLVCPVLQ